ncbi:MAG: serine/threonine-protein kinase, partial [Bradymonadaceae bacterium]
DEDVDAGVLERFSQEARLTCQINHPNVVTIYEFGQDDRGLLYLAMEWLDGDSLNTHLAENRPLEAAQVARFGAQIADGLEAAHRHEILHRDLKPSNIMIARLPTGERQAIVLDFGIAKALDPPVEDQIRITQEGMFVGTPRYAAPEQIRGEELTPRSDIYGTGLLLWEAIVGDPAVPTLDFQECCTYHLSEDRWELPTEANCPKPLADVIERCLEKDPDDRFGSCADLAEALRDVTEQLEAAPSETTPAPSASSWSGRWSRVLFGLLVGLAVIALFAYPSLLSLDSEETTNRRPPAANGALVETPRALGTQLERRGWRLDGTLPKARAD